jgi:cytochrome c oxidase cbb3-type subunit 3
VSDKDKNNEEVKELEHEYDGITEYDHPLPRWWLATFWAGIIFAIAYFAYYQLGSGPSIRDEFQQQMTAHQLTRDAYLAKMNEFDVEHFEKIYKTSDVLEFGESLFVANCQSCHGEGAKGDIGPNLTDRFWLFSMGNPQTVYPFILSGNPNNGMPSWSDKLDKEEIYAILAYIMNQQGTQHQNAKAEEGNEFKVWKPGMKMEDSL